MIAFIEAVWRFFKPFYKKIDRDNIFAIAGQSAFFLILSVVPLVMFLVSLLQGLHIPSGSVNRVVGAAYAETELMKWVQSLNEMYSDAAGISVLTLIATLWSASKGMHAITNGLNRVQHTFESRNWFVVRLRSMLYTFVCMLIIVVTVGVVFLGSALSSRVEPYLGKLPGYVVMIYSLRYVIVFLYQVFLFALLYRNVPNLRREKRKEYGIRCQLPGALFCAASWHVLLFGISIYVTDFNGFSIYKGLTQLAVAMIFTYFCMVCLMIGAEINVYFHREIDWFTMLLIPGFIRKRMKKDVKEPSEKGKGY